MKKTDGPPKGLSREMRQFWRDVLREFELAPDALCILELATRNWDRATQARLEVDRDGLTKDGKRHPAVDIEKQAYGLFLRALRQLGLDVVAPGPPGRPPATEYR